MKKMKSRTRLQKIIYINKSKRKSIKICVKKLKLNLNI